MATLDVMDLPSFDVEKFVTGYGPEQDGSADAEPQIDRAAELNRKWKVKTGDLWRIGEHRLLCGDSTKREDVDRVMDGEKADLCFTSPPYGASQSACTHEHYVKGKPRRKSLYDKHEDKPDEWLSLMNGWYDLAESVCHSIAVNVQMLSGNKPHLLPWVCSHIGNLIDVIVWDKVNGPPQMHKSVLTNAFEFIFILGGNGSRIIPFSSWHGSVCNVFHCTTAGKNDLADVHNAVFTSDLPRWMIGTVFDLSASVYDPFLGSGTTMVACQNLSRKCRGIEISPDYCAVILERMATAFPGIEVERVDKA